MVTGSHFDGGKSSSTILIGTIAVLSTQCTVWEVPDLDRVPGIVIDHSPARSDRYVGCPSIAVLAGGDYLASHSFFGPGASNDRTVVFRSGDRGQTWRRVADVDGQFWSTLFTLGDEVYLMGVDRARGRAVIRRSTDGGSTWTTPRNRDSGVLIDHIACATGPVPVIAHGGRVWRTYEEAAGRWGRGFRPFVVSAAVDADLLCASSWTVSERLDWPRRAPYDGWLEGNVVPTRNGPPAIVLRVHEPEAGGKAALVRIADASGRELSFDHESDFIDLPGGCKKFTIRFDPLTDRYWALTNPFLIPGRSAERTRNTLVLISSQDLANWSVRSVVLHHPDAQHVGFQYVDWQFDGDDLIAVMRTAFADGLGGAHSAHDANLLTFHRIRGFRNADRGEPGPTSFSPAGR